MRTALPAKRVIDNATARRVWESIGDYVTAEQARSAVERAAGETRRLFGPHLHRAVYGWSGGKDSLALQVVMEAAGVRRAVLGIIPAVEFRSYLAWVDRHRPDDLTVYENREITPAWLARPDRARFLFPTTAADGYFWALASARYAQHRYQSDHQPEVQIFGRRTRDGNVCGDADGVQRSKRMIAYNPMRDWSHELVLGVVHHYGRQLPPTYSWPSGWRTGTGSWPGRRVGTREQSWAETWHIEPDRVREAAEHLPEAAAWMDRHGLT